MASISRALSGLVNEVAAALEPRRRSKRRRLPLTFVERGRRYEIYRNARRGPALLAAGDLASLAVDRLPREALKRPVEVRLDGSRMFDKLLQLPAASRNYLDAVVTHQLERTTPWSADRVVFDYAVEDGAETSKDQVAVRLVATSRDVYDASMDRLAAAGVRPGLVGTSEHPLDVASPVNLMQAGRTARRDALRRKVAIGLALVAVLGAAGSGWAGWRLHRLNAESAALGAQIDVARDTIEAARRTSEQSESYARLLQRKRDTMPIVVLIDQLSQIVPTSTYLTELSVQGEELRMAGLSSDAPGLIGILESAASLADVHFAAPTVSGEGDARDRFEILARVVPAGGASP